MDWTAVITRNQALLVRILAELFAMLRMAGGSPLSVTGFARDTSPRKRGEVEGSASGLTSPLRGEVSAKPTERGLRADAPITLPRHLYNAILALLRPAESAIRRLIIIAARGLVLKVRVSRLLPINGFPVAANSGRAPSFQLIDPLKSFALDQWNAPLNTIMFTHVTPEDPALAYQNAQAQNKPVNAALLFNRLRAMRIALSDIPRQARRLARWRALRDLALKASRPTRMSPFRPGPPPGYRRKHLHPVDAVLQDLHYFAWEAWANGSGNSRPAGKSQA